MSFFIELWESIFTPGPTPVIVKATNISFAALQALLLALFIATYSIHFVALSILCGGLWWAINWFAAELDKVKREEADKAPETEQKSDTATATATATEGEENNSYNNNNNNNSSNTKSRAATRQVSSASTEDEWEKISQ